VAGDGDRPPVAAAMIAAAMVIVRESMKTPVVA
jgi:hypothetical protein